MVARTLPATRYANLWPLLYWALTGIGALYCAVETFGLLLPRSSDGLREHKQ